MLHPLPGSSTSSFQERTFCPSISTISGSVGRPRRSFHARSPADPGPCRGSGRCLADPCLHPGIPPAQHPCPARRSRPGDHPHLPPLRWPGEERRVRAVWREGLPRVQGHELRHGDLLPEVPHPAVIPFFPLKIENMIAVTTSLGLQFAGKHFAFQNEDCP